MGHHKSLLINAMKERIIKHWITSIFGAVVMIIALVLWILGRIDAWGLIPAGLFGLALFRSRDRWIDKMIQGVFNRSGASDQFDQRFSNTDRGDN